MSSTLTRRISRLLLTSTMAFSLPPIAPGAKAETVTFNADERASADSLIKQKRAIDEIFESIITHYGMEGFKEFQFGFKLEDLRKKYYTYAEKGMLPDGYKNPTGLLSRIEFQQLLIALCAAFKDGHFNMARTSSAIWTTGIKTSEINGHLIVTAFDPNIYNSANNSTPIMLGDEVVSIDDVPVEELAEKNKKYVQMATYATRYKRAIQSLLTYSERTFMPKEENQKVKIGFVTPGTTEVRYAYARWTKLGRGSESVEKKASYEQALSWIGDVHGFDAPITAKPTKKTASLNGVTDQEIQAYRYGDRSRVSYFRVGVTQLIESGLGQITDVG